MIRTTRALEPTHWGLTAEERAARGRWFAIVAAVLCGFVHLAWTTPVGLLWPVLFFVAIMALVAVPAWLVGLVHAIGARRRHPCAYARRAVLWWLFPAVAIGATFGAIDADLPRETAARLLERPLAELVDEANAAAGSVERANATSRSLVTLDDRFVGPYPCKDVRRYPNGTLRVEFRGTGLFEGRRGLVRVADGGPVPSGLDITGDAVIDGWLPWLEYDGR